MIFCVRTSPQSAQDVQIRARVEGVLESMHFTEGSFVKSNDLLYVIEPYSLEASLERLAEDLDEEQYGHVQGFVDQATAMFEAMNAIEVTGMTVTQVVGE